MSKIDINDCIGLIVSATTEGFKKNEMIRTMYEFDETLSENVIRTYALIENFDESKGYKFSTYLYKSLKFHMMNIALRDKEHFIRDQRGDKEIITPIAKSSLNEVVKSEVGENERMDYLQAATNLEDDVINKVYVEELLSNVEGIKRFVLERYFFDDCVQSEIAKEIGVSQVRVARIIKTSLSKLKEEVI